MAYNSVTDFMALLRNTPQGAALASAPMLDMVLSALARGGMFRFFVSQSPPVENQSTTVWLRPANPTWSAEGVTYLFNGSAWVQATPELWAALFSSGLGPDLQALNSMTTRGIVVREGDGAFTTRALVPPAGGIAISNPDGVAGPPTFSLTGDLAAVEGLTGANVLPYRIGDTGWGTATFGPAITFVGGLLDLDPDLNSIAAIGATNVIPYRLGAGTWGTVTIGGGLIFTGGVLSAPSGAAQTYFVRAVVQAVDASGVNSFLVVRYAASSPTSYATYILGSPGGIGALQDAAGHWYNVDVSSGIIDARWFGVVGDGVTDDSAALQAWLFAINNAPANINVKGKLFNGNITIASANLPNGLVITRSNVTIDGDGATITVTGGSQVTNIFSTLDRSNIIYENINFVGNSIGGFGQGGAIAFNCVNLDISGLDVRNCSFDNFQSDYWIYVEPLGAFNHAIQEVVVENNSFISRNGNCRGPTNLGINSSFVGILGVGNTNPSLPGTPTPSAFVRGVRVQNNYMRADFIKTGVQFFENLQEGLISGNKIINAGQLGGIIDDVGSYAIMVYENEGAGQPTYGRNVIITDNYIFNCRDNGLYMAGPWTNSVVANNIVNGQTSIAVGTLPKGGLSINGSAGITITGNRLTSIAADGITYNCPPGSVNVGTVIANNYCDSGAGFNGIRLLNGGAAVGAGTTSKISITDNICNAGGLNAGILVNTFDGGGINTLNISGNETEGGGFGIRFLANGGTGTLNIDGVNVKGNFIRSPSIIGIDFGQIQGNGPTVLQENIVYGAPATASYNISNTLNGIFQNNVVSGQNSGFGWITANARGGMRGNSFDRTPNANIVATSGATDLGRVIPSYVPAGAGDQSYVQNFLQSELVGPWVAPNKYVLQGWGYSVATGAWLQNRALTGN